MLHCAALLLILAWSGSATALTPPLDASPGFFAGEWAGNGEHGSYCYLKLSADGRGWVLVDGGTGDWLGARLQWRNRQQTIQVDTLVPMAVSPERRIMPLETFVLRSGFNESLSLTWNARSSGCHLQKIEASSRHLRRARDAIEALPQDEGKR